MSRRKTRESQSLSLSFLDAVTCGFGAIILLLVIAKIFEPIRLEESNENLQGIVARHERELEQIVGETERLEREQREVEQTVTLNERQIEDLRIGLTELRAELNRTEDDALINSELEGRLARARQDLTEEMRRLLADYEPPLDDYKVGGIPVDSEYIIFIVDTSGSMQRYAWDRVQQQISETLQVYPTVKGIQVMNDEGTYLFTSTSKKWIDDSPAIRNDIINAMRDWESFSDSSPREGILAAIDTFYDPDKRISLYVYSDDFQQGSINSVVREVDRRNSLDDAGNRRVRIHAVAFPVYYEVFDELYTSANFAMLMRELCLRNGGTFVALPSKRDI